MQPNMKPAAHHIPPMLPCRSKTFRYAKRSCEVFALLCLIALMATTALYGFHNKQDDAKRQFKSFSDTLMHSFKEQMMTNIETLHLFSTMATVLASNTGQSWPRVKLPDFDRTAAIARHQLQTHSLRILPIVSAEDRKDWESFVQIQVNHTDATGSADKYVEDGSPTYTALTKGSKSAQEGETVMSSIFTLSGDGIPIVDSGEGPFVPIWQTSMDTESIIVGTGSVNYNLLSHPLLWTTVERAMESNKMVMSEVTNLNSAGDPADPTLSDFDDPNPISTILYPIFDKQSTKKSNDGKEGNKEGQTTDQSMVAMLGIELDWTTLFGNALPSVVNGIVCVVQNQCHQSFSMRVDGDGATFLGSGDFHDPEYNDFVQRRSIVYFGFLDEDLDTPGLDFEHCPFTLHLYPSNETFESSRSFMPSIYSGVFLLLTIVVLLGMYGLELLCNKFRPKKNRELETITGCSEYSGYDSGWNSSANPPDWDRQVQHEHNMFESVSVPQSVPPAPQTYMGNNDAFGAGHVGHYAHKLVDATILCVSVDRMRSWKRSHSEDDLYALLDVIKRTMRMASKRHDVAQIDIVQDKVVAATASTSTEDDHAVMMTCFASDCHKRLDRALSGNSRFFDAALAFGLHSGQVQTNHFGGGESGLDLFGDTVDIASEILKSSRAWRIQASVETAELINLAGCGGWIIPRREHVSVKGRGNMSTYWIDPDNCLDESWGKSNSNDDDNEMAFPLSSIRMVESCGASIRTDKPERSLISTVAESESSRNMATFTTSPAFQEDGLMDQCVDIILEYMKRIHAMRDSKGYRKASSRSPISESKTELGDFVLDEAEELVELPRMQSLMLARQIKCRSESKSSVGRELRDQIRAFVSSVASSYRPNEFHNFERACMALLSMHNLLEESFDKAISKHFGVDDEGTINVRTRLAGLHQSTFGIISDPICQLGMLLAALVQDVDRIGVSNDQLVREMAPIATLYNNRCVAEQNSIHIAWWLLQTPAFDYLRRSIYTTNDEMMRFRQVLVTSVIATDVSDKTLQAKSASRWKQAFPRRGPTSAHDESSPSPSPSHRLLQAKKSTSVLHLFIKIANVSYMMQEFNMFLEWSERSFAETYQAYQSGRAECDPIENWYAKQLRQYDEVTIPLLRQLERTDLLPHRTKELLANATANRDDWEQTGEQWVDQFLQGTDDDDSARISMDKASKVSMV